METLTLPQTKALLFPLKAAVKKPWVAAAPALEEKEEGYDEWLRARLERTIQKLDSGEMSRYTTEELRAHLDIRRARWRAQRNAVNAN